MSERNDNGNRFGNRNQTESSFHSAVASLCMCSLANAFVIINVFPYSGYMVLHLIPKSTPENAGIYAGFLASSFMIGRFVTAYWWGRCADTFGRVVVLKFSLVLSTLFCLLFGLAKTYRTAFLWRLCLGMANAVTSTSKTLASEIGQGDEVKERQAMGLVVGMRSWGFLLGPAIGGFLASPVKQYPKNPFWQSGWRHRILEEYPFLLPNIAVALFCIVSSIMVSFLIEETLQDDRTFSLPRHQQNPEVQNLIADPCAKEDKKQERSIWSNLATRKHMLFYWMFSFVVTVIDEAFPLFCISTDGGLSLDEGSIGKILSSAGLLFAIFQYAVYSLLTSRFGLYPSIFIGCIFGLVPVSLVPLSIWFELNNRPQWFVFGYLGLVLGASKIMACTCFSGLAIATNKTVNIERRARMNSFVLLGGSIAKGLGPIFAGFLVTISLSQGSLIKNEMGPTVIFGTIGIMGLIVSYAALRLKKADNG